jgi:membrane protein DedA with SNARE-associated domain
VIIAGSIYASAGSLNIYAVGAIAFVAATVGDNIAYVIGRQGGGALVTRYGRYLGVSEGRYAKTERFFAQHGGKIVVVARFIEGLRQVNGLVAGTTKMPYLRFLVAQVLGAALWVGVWSAVGYTAGSHITTIYDGVTKAGYVLLAIAVVALAVWLVRRRARTHQS